MRYQEFKSDKYYIVEVGGAAAQQIFFDDEDRVRFIFLITHLLSPIRVANISWYSSRFFKAGTFTLGKSRVDEIYNESELNLISFGVYSKSFALLVHTKQDFILSVYMQRVLTSYGKYFNSKYKKKGHVFNGPFMAKEVNANDLCDASAYIHLNILGENVKFDDYKWTSFLDFVGPNRWGKLLSCDKLLAKLKTDYHEYLKSLRYEHLKGRFSLNIQ